MPITDKVIKTFVVGILSVVVTVGVWFLAARYLPPPFDAKETTLLFFVCFAAVSLLAAIWEWIGHRKR
jgi:hypothetical protein